jgi:transposase
MTFGLATYDIMSKAKRNPKADRLKENDSLNLHPERVRAKQFQNSTFFDPRDLVQVKYEMLREVRHEGASKVQAAASYGMSRQAFYQALNAFTVGGIAGLLPAQRGPKGAHKLTDEVMAFIERRQAEDPGLHAKALAAGLREELHLVVHPRSIERALARKKKR